MSKRKKRLGNDPFADRKKLGWIGHSEEGAEDTEGNNERTNEEDESAQKVSDEKEVSGLARSAPEREVERSESVTDTTSQKSGSADSTRAGLDSGYKRHTFILREDLVRKIKALSFQEDRPMKEIVEEAFTEYLSDKSFPW